MRSLMIAAVLSFVSGAAEACENEYRARHCHFCVEVWRMEQQEVSEQVLVRCEEVVVGYEDVWVDETVTEMETRTRTRRIFVGWDGCRGPIFRLENYCDSVPVCKTIRVCRKQPIVEKRPVYETRIRCVWVRVPYYICAR